jgi:hypothetical protein
MIGVAIAMLLLMLVLGLAGAQAEKRIALLLGNQTYAHATQMRCSKFARSTLGHQGALPSFDPARREALPGSRSH